MIRHLGNLDSIYYFLNEIATRSFFSAFYLYFMYSRFDASGFSDVPILLTDYHLIHHGDQTDRKDRIDKKQAYIILTNVCYSFSFQEIYGLPLELESLFFSIKIETVTCRVIR